MRRVFLLVLLLLATGCTIAYESNPVPAPPAPKIATTRTIFLKCEERYFRHENEINVAYRGTRTEEALRGLLPRQVITDDPSRAELVLKVEMRERGANSFINYMLFSMSLGVLPLYSDLSYDLDAEAYDTRSGKRQLFRVSREGYAWDGWLFLPLLPVSHISKTDKAIKDKMLRHLVSDMQRVGVFSDPEPPPVAKVETPTAVPTPPITPRVRIDVASP